VTQALYGITLYSEAATRTLAVGDLTTLAGHLRDLQDTAQEALQELRLLIFELRPPLLEQEGLEAALRARLEAVEGRSHLDMQFSVGGEISVSARIEQALYRIAQETLNNILKHACARRVSVSLRQEAAQISLEIADDGVGFDPAATQRRGGMGLPSMIERVHQLRGQISVLSAPGHGTRVRVEVPL
jgi:signal transduction histidine kinase